MTVNRVSWKQVGLVQEPGRYMLRFGWVTVTADDLQVWSLFPEATFALYEVPVWDPSNLTRRIQMPRRDSRVPPRAGVRRSD